MNPLRVGILGATGMVGQRFIQLLHNHPWFRVTEVAASERSAGKRYRDAVNWKMAENIPSDVADLTVKLCKPSELRSSAQSCDFVFSALDSDVAGDVELEFARAGIPVVSTAKNYRMEHDVPMIIPEINADHIDIIPIQRKNRGFDRGFIAVKPNCSLQSYLIALYPLHRQFRMTRLIITTMQAVSGAGYPGVPSLDIVDNVVPFIGGEEEKSEQESYKIFGTFSGEKIEHTSDIIISAHCNRVPVIDGHLATISVEFEKKPSREEILRLWKDFRSVPQELELPSAPDPVIYYREEENRPQPRLDRDAGQSVYRDARVDHAGVHYDGVDQVHVSQSGANYAEANQFGMNHAGVNRAKGMAVTCGRLRPCHIFDWRFVCLSHNTIRGAAGGSILLAELLKARGYL
ncbi:aspartate-semialdehyde dehydrogenase [Candidatus Peregrinibacteria bacterium]|nr:aspartate-semialdehyde dehydrogenase [Candidatus Peregrinibacteria bacterium]